MTYRLSARAAEDLIQVYLEGVRLFGEAHAEAYHRDLAAVLELLSENPKLARERGEISPPVRILPFKAHLVVYVMDEDGGILVVRIRHGHEDWAREDWAGGE